MMISQKKAYQELWKRKEVKKLVRAHFGFDLTKSQEEIVRIIAYQETDLLDVCAMTRYGKTQCVAIGTALFILWNRKRKVMFIAPTRDKAAILRDYMADLVLISEDLLQLADLDVKGKERLKKEASKSRLTFKNGCEYRIFSAHGEGSSLMGFGLGSWGGIVVKDEACEIDDKANTKITRMLGDSPKNTMLVELFNPWTRNNKAFEHWNDPDWYKIHVSWKKALEEGRTTQEFIDRQRKEITPLEFTVLYDSEFPEEEEDSIFNLSKIKLAQKQDFNFEEELLELEKKLSNPTNYLEHEILKAKEQIKRYKRIISCDPADLGLDYTVNFWGVKKDLKYQLTGVFSEPKSDPMEIVGRIIERLLKTYNGITSNLIHIDRIGIGTGPLSRLKEVIKEKGLKNVKVVGCHFGETAIKDDHYRNKKAENYFRAQALFNEDMIKIIDKKELTNQLLSMKWKLSSSSKREIVDPDKSPDFADSLVYFVWEDKTELAFDFIPTRVR